MDKKRLLFDARIIQERPYFSISKDAIQILQVLYENKNLDVSILVHTTSWYYDFVSNIKIRKLRPFFWAIYLLFNFYKTILPQYRTPKDLRKHFSVKNLRLIMSVTNGEIFRILYVDRMVEFLMMSLHHYCLQYLYKHYAYIFSFFKWETKQFDYIFLPWIVPINNVHSSTKKIIRYHDGIPLLFPKLYDKKLLFSRTLHISMNEHSIFMCQSKTTEQELIDLYPDAHNRVSTIPILINPYQRTIDKNTCTEIIQKRYSLQSIEQDSSFVNTYLSIGNTVRYILHVSDFVKRKNHLNLVRAFDLLKKEMQDDLRLILIGSGPMYEDTELIQVMKPYVLSSDIIHLKNLAENEMPYLYSHAECFVFPSFIEGFGMPPMEAMQCGCPCIVSDIPVHHWVFDDAALRINPHSAHDIRDKLKILLYSEEKEAIKQELIQKGYERTKLFSKKNIVPQWNEFVSQL